MKPKSYAPEEIDGVYKSCSKLGTEFQSNSYDTIVSHTTIVFNRYIFLECVRRNLNDQKTYGELFYIFCDDIQRHGSNKCTSEPYTLFMEQLSSFTADITNMNK